MHLEPAIDVECLSRNVLAECRREKCGCGTDVLGRLRTIKRYRRQRISPRLIDGDAARLRYFGQREPAVAVGDIVLQPDGADSLVPGLSSTRFSCRLIHRGCLFVGPHHSGATSASATLFLSTMTDGMKTSFS